jgi:FAD/FMN-containing dehydrogenase
MWAHFLPTSDSPDWPAFYKDFADKATRVGGSVVIERMPDMLRQADTPVWAPLLADFALMRQLKQGLDPERMWNPGRFVGRL